MQNDANLLFHWSSNGMNYFLKKKEKDELLLCVSLFYNDFAITRSLSTIEIWNKKFA